MSTQYTGQPQNVAITVGGNDVTPENPLPSSEPLSTAITTGQQAATASAVKLNGGTPTAFAGGFLLRNKSDSSASIFYGPAGVTTATGQELPAGAADFIPLADASAVYVIAAGAGTSTAAWSGYS